MTDISTTLAASTTATQSASDQSFESKSSVTLGQDIETFLTLLTTQLQNQDPFDPMDTSEFTNQLVQFSEVEQSINMNEKLQDLLDFQATSQATVGINYIGLEAQIKGNTFTYAQGFADIGYQLPDTASEIRAFIIDNEGNVVRTLEPDGAPGNHTVTWDGLDDGGQWADPGSYRVQFSAFDSTGDPIEVETTVPGVIVGFETGEDGTIYLNVNDQTVPVSDVTSARYPGTTTNEDATGGT